MGFFDFFKKKNDDAGIKPVIEAPVENKGQECEEFVKSLGLNIQDLSVMVNEGVATVSGKADSIMTQEKAILAIGNIAGIKAVEENIEIPAETVEVASQYYTIEKGDTLWKIAQATLGDGNRYKEIFEANTPMLADPDHIFPGQVLRIPQ